MEKRLLFLMVLLMLLLAACGRNTPEPHAEVIPLSINIDAYNDYLPYDAYEVVLPDIPLHNEYVVTLEVDPEMRTVQGISRIHFTNRSDEPMETIVLRVFLNAFDPGIYPRPYTGDEEWRLYRPGPDSGRGYMSIEYVFINNEASEYTLDGTILTLYLEEPIMPDVTALLSLQYNAYVPEFGHIMGGNDIGMWFGMFLPMLSVHGEDGWHAEAFYPVGNPFFLETANYQVEITTPFRYNVVGTGHRTEEIIYDTDIKITRFTANMARDFAFAVLSPYYSSAGITTDSGVEINFHYHTELVGGRVEEILEFARFSMESFEHFVGVYPFGQIHIVETDLQHNTAAFSQMIFADTRLLRHGELTDLSLSLGSQWFSSVVGVNRIAEPWLDKGLTRFVQAHIAHNTPELLHEYIQQVHESIAGRTDLHLTDGLWVYETRQDFVAAQGYRAMLMLYQLQQRMGEEAFWAFIHLYYQTFSFSIAGVADFMYMAETIYDGDLQAFFDVWMTSDVVPPLQ